MNNKIHCESITQKKDSWRFYLMTMGVILSVFVLVYSSTLFDIVSIWWKSRTFNHGFVIVPISLYLIWQKRDVLLQHEPKSSKLVWIVLSGLVAMWVVANLADVQLIQQFSVVSMLPVLVYVLFGRDVVKLILFPLGFLIFAVPFGEFMVPILQDITAVFTVEALRLTGIPVYLEGRFISIPSGNFKVAEACSGVRYLIASVALGTLYAYITYYSLWRRSIFILFSILLPIAANSVRAYGIVMLAHLSDYELATGFDHLIYGWMFFGLVMILLFWVGAFFRDDPPESASDKAKIPNTKNIVPDKKANIIIAFVTIIILLSGPLTAQWLNEPIAGANSISLPFSDGAWSGPVDVETQWNAYFKGATSELNGEYRNGKDSIQLYIAYYASQSQGAEIVNSENAYYDQTSLRRAGANVVEYQASNGDHLQVSELLLSSDQNDMLLWHWYEVSGVSTNDAVGAKLAQIRAKLLRESQASAVVMIRAEIKVNQATTEKLIRSFVDQMLPSLKQTIYKK